MKKFSLITLTQLICLGVPAQANYPVLTDNISYGRLREKCVERKLEWKNPDGSGEELRIIEMTIPFGEVMKQRTKEFVHKVYQWDSIWLKPRMLVFHAMGDGDLKTSLEVSSFLSNRVPDGWGNLSKAGLLPNGAHFIIDQDGTVICLSAPVSNDGKNISYEPTNHRWIIKRHQDGNPLAIGIENVTPKGDYTTFTKEQLASNAKLARWLIWFEHGEIDFVTSHHQFNEDKNYDEFLKSFSLQNLKKQFRTKGRKDIGDENLTEILNQINSFGIQVKNFFE